MSSKSQWIVSPARVQAQTAETVESAEIPVQAGGWKALAQNWTQRGHAQPARNVETPRDTAHASLGKYKQSLKEYQAAQQAHRQLREKAAGELAPRDKAQVAQALRRIEAQLDSLERELRGGRLRTKAALDEARAAS
jgi:hypothetical protein